MSRTRITLEIGADFDAYLSESMRDEHPPSLVVHSGETELVLAGGTVKASDRLTEAVADWRAALVEVSP